MAGCVFCGARPTTNEHVFPQWLLDVIPGEGELTHTWAAPEGSASISREWTNEALDFKANVVCGPDCNSGWMERLETRARPFLEPMIRGRRAMLLPEGARTVAHWALKTALMIDFAQEPEHRSVPASVYQELYSAQDVTPQTFVWVAACEFGAGALARGRTLHLGPGDSDEVGFGATICVGHLVLEIIRVPTEDEKTLEIGGELAASIRRLWPYTNLVSWPPAAVLDREEVSGLGTLIERSPTRLSERRVS
jgi:hypothetical protein